MAPTLDPAADPVDIWNEVLRAYSDTLEAQRSLLLSLQPEGMPEHVALLPVQFVPPSGLPPIPAESLPWARALQRETAGLADLAADVLERTRPAPAALRRTPSAPPTAGAFDRTM